LALDTSPRPSGTARMSQPFRALFLPYAIHFNLQAFSNHAIALPVSANRRVAGNIDSLKDELNG
jgi:hypothetical protein